MGSLERPAHRDIDFSNYALQRFFTEKALLARKTKISGKANALKRPLRGQRISVHKADFEKKTSKRR